MKSFQGVFAILLAIGVVSLAIPDGFVNVLDVVPNIIVEMRYYTMHNFVGSPIIGYDTPQVNSSKASFDSPPFGLLSHAMKKKGVNFSLAKGYLPLRLPAFLYSLHQTFLFLWLYVIYIFSFHYRHMACIWVHIMERRRYGRKCCFVFPSDRLSPPFLYFH